MSSENVVVGGDDYELDGVSQQIYQSAENSMARSMVEKEKKNPTYRENKRFLGWKIFDKNDWQRGRAEKKKKQYRKGGGKDSQFFMTIDKEQNICGILGQVGTGKTVILRGIQNRGYLAGVRGIHLADVKGEMYSNNLYGGVQKKIDGKQFKNLRKLERPTEVRTKMLMPKFIDEYSDEDTPDYNNFFQFSFEDLTYDDFMTLMPTGTDARKQVIGDLYDKLSEGDLDGFDDAISFVEEELQNATNKRTLVSALESLQSKNIVGTKYQRDICGMLEDNKRFLAVNMTGHDDVSETGAPAMYVGKNVRDLRKSKKGSSGIPEDEPIELYLDEAHSFLKEGNSAHKWILKNVKVDRYLKFRLVWATHLLEDFESYSGGTKPSDLPEIVSQTKHFILPPDYSADRARPFLKLCGVWRSTDTDMWRDIFALMNDLRNRSIYCWLYLNSNGNWSVFEAASSIAYHG